MKKCKTCPSKGPFPIDKGKPRPICAECFNNRRRARYAKVPDPKKLKDPGPQPLRRTAPKAKRYVVTYAQNATPVHKPFLEALLVYCKENDAELLIIPGRYKNPTSVFTQAMYNEHWWDRDVHKWLFSGRVKLGEHLTVYGDISIQPTATRPLTGFEVFSGTASAIFGHPKLQLTTVATAKRRYPRILTTTGAVTKPNYTKSKAGKKSEAHHVYGATVVEQGERLFHIRQINAKRDGSFVDLDREYTAEGSREAGRALALICGDIHVEQSDKQVLDATFNRADSIVKTLRPETIVYHDVLDFNRRNHHTIADFCNRYARATMTKLESVEDEVLDAISFIDQMTPSDTRAVVVASNHDEAFDRWLNEANPKLDPKNARFYHEMWAAKLEAFDEQGYWTPAFQLLYQRKGGEARFLSREESLKIGDIYVNFHGDEGINGAKGSRQGYAQLGAKTVIGHGHSPGILDGCTQVGVTGRLDQGYNPPPSSWLNSHCVIYSNGKRSLIHVVEDAWRGGK
jgi:hypothetical protein